MHRNLVENFDFTFFSCSGISLSTLFSFESFLASSVVGVDSLLSLEDLDRDDDDVSGCLSVSCDCTETESSSKSSGIAGVRGSYKTKI